MNQFVKQLDNEGYWTNSSLLKEIFEEAEIGSLPQSVASHVPIIILIMRLIKQNIDPKSTSWLKQGICLAQEAGLFSRAQQKYEYEAQWFYEQ